MSLSQGSFDAVAGLFEKVSGIRLVAAKKPLVEGRLQRLAQQAGHARLDDYVHQLMHAASAEEITRVVDKLTTNETYFFREPQHYDHLKAQLPTLLNLLAGQPLRVWSAASSSGEEAYSLAMLLDEELGDQTRWEIVGTDLSTQMVQHGKRALYTLDRARNLSPARLKRHCLRGTGEYEGHVLVQRHLREHVNFGAANLMRELPRTLGRFDVIFLRNVLIYFDPPAKAAIVRRVLGQLKPDGLLYTGHAESLANLDVPVRSVATAVYAHAT